LVKSAKAVTLAMLGSVAKFCEKGAHERLKEPMD